MTISQAQGVQCVVCGHVGTPWPTLGGLLRQCESCDFTWTDENLPSPAEPYTRACYEADGYQSYFSSRRQRRFVSARRLRWLRSQVRPATLLEAGPADGYFLEAAHGAGIRATGVEVCEAAARFAREQLGVPVRHGTFETTPPPEPVDTVCAFHVLEHVEDPHQFLRAAHDALVPSGWLALEVPNIVSAAARRLGAQWPAVATAYHRWHFSPQTLTRLLRRNGFEVVSYDTVFSRFYWQPRARLAHARGLLVADAVASSSLRVAHPHLGDLLRLFARRNDPRPVLLKGRAIR